METQTQSTTESRLAGVRWLVFARSLLIVLALCAAAVWSLSAPAAAGYLNQLMVVLAGILTLSVASLWWRAERTLVTQVQLGFDVVLATGAIYFTGGAASPLLFLYLLPVIAGAFLHSRRVALTMTACGAGAYLLLMWALLHSEIPPAWGDQVVELPRGGLALQVVGLLSGMILVAVLTSYLVGRIEKGVVLLAQSQRELLESTRHSQTLVEGLPTAVITVDLDGAVSAANPAACSMVGASAERLIGSSLRGALTAIGLWDKVAPLIGNSGAIEGEIEGNGRPDPTLVAVNAKPVLDASGAVTGTILVMTDITRLRTAENQLQMQERMARLLSEPEANKSNKARGGENFVGESPVMIKVFNLIERVAPTDATVLISGESGTGKELVARAIHGGSERASKPFIPVNCGAIPENLIESELFGHKKGSFTGADADHVGLIRQAEGGTLLLDEIGELPLHMQTKLLRTIQQRCVRPVGGERDIPINVRIVAATNRNLKREIEKGGFREDLFYRLNVININLPALRERKDDIPILVSATLKRLRKGEAIPVIPPATMDLLQRYEYPGNVRELENILERAVVLGGEAILPEHLPESVRHPGSENLVGSRETQIIIAEDLELPVKLDDVLGSIEQRYLEVALVRTNGARKKAADLLGINFRSFRYRLQKFGIHDEDGE